MRGPTARHMRVLLVLSGGLAGSSHSMRTLSGAVLNLISCEGVPYFSASAPGTGWRWLYGLRSL
ncbi:hypothetical protein Axi01nite_87550 [Actinoplanes xinjiangensis]|nr:hypothetical protein Axi01nite_87550 [Actinoplanes xinjiangensis]